MGNRTGYLWQIRLFGGPTLESSQGDGRTESHFRSAKVAALLGYLALHHGKPCSRESLIEALWPDESDSQAIANRFRVTLASLRRQLEPQGFPFGTVLDTSVPGCVILSASSVWCDVSEFERLYTKQDMNAAAELLVAPLLPSIYDDWASSEQVRYELFRDELAPFLVSSATTPDTESREIDFAAHRLPLFLSSFFSRKRELEILQDLLANHRLVTITGPGGVGKTRLSVEACKQSDVRSIFVPLVDCSSRDEVAESIIRHLSINSQTALDPIEQLVDVLPRLGPIRLLLDNAEHLVEESAEVIEAILQAAPEIMIVVSSRQTLEIMGEQVMRVTPLDVPNSSVDATLSSLGEFPSTTLFIDRVRQSRPDFVATEAQAKSIFEICRQLDGLPLAIELAAAQITVISISKILESLESSLVDLKSRRRSLSARHRSLRAAIQSSLDGLDAETLRFLGQVSVFWGGWTAEHAEAITRDSSALERLEELIVRSLVSTEIVGENLRFTCLEVIRQLAQEALAKSDLQELTASHSSHFLTLASQVDDNDLRSLRPLDSEDYNLSFAFQNANPSDQLFWKSSRGAIIHSFVRGHFRTGLKWIRDYGPYVDKCLIYEDRREWRIAALQVLPELGLYGESMLMLELLRKDATENIDLIGATFADIFEGLLAARLGDFEKGIRLHKIAVNQARDLGNTILLESALAHLSGSLHEVGRIKETPKKESRELLEEAELFAVELIELVSTQSRRHPLAHLLAGVAAFYQSKYDEAKIHLGHAWTSALRHDITTVTMYVAFFEAEIAREQGRSEIAESKFSIFERLRDQTGIIFGSGKWG